MLLHNLQQLKKIGHTDFSLRQKDKLVGNSDKLVSISSKYLRLNLRLPQIERFDDAKRVNATALQPQRCGCRAVVARQPHLFSH